MAVFFASTVAPATADPEGSVTVPVKVAVEIWADRFAAARNMTAAVQPRIAILETVQVNHIVNTPLLTRASAMLEWHSA